MHQGIRIVVLGISMLWLSVMPAWAQTPAPFPTPPSAPLDLAERAADIATEAVERIGISAFVPAIVSVIALLLVVLAGALLLRFGIKPFFDLVQDERKARKEERDERLQAQRELTELRERQAAAQEKQTEYQERQVAASEQLATMMQVVESRTEAGTRTNSAVSAINTHTDNAHQATLNAIQRMLNQVIIDLGGVQQKQAQRAPDDHTTADLTITNAQRTLVEVNEQVKKLHDTGPLGQPALPQPSPAPVPPPPLVKE